MSNQFPHLFSPISLGPVEIPNRVVFSAHSSHLVEGGLPTEAQAHYYAERAKGGAGWIVIGGSVVHESSYQHPTMNIVCKDAIPGYRRIVDMVHANGAKISTQMDHWGDAIGYPRAGRGPLMSPSGIADVAGLETPKIMEESDMVELIEASAEGARVAKESGFDGIELLGSMGFSLIQLFLSPRMNRRTDEYGGSTENRMRFPLRLMERVREVIGDDMCLGLKLSGDEFIEGGLDQEEALKIAVAFAETGLLDYLHICVGTLTDSSLWLPEMSYSPGLVTYLAAGVREKVDIPVIAIKRINDPVQAEQIIADGEADIVAMARALIADPELPKKAQEGRLREIRQCTGSNQECAHRSSNWLAVSCIHNPAVGREAEWGIGTLHRAAAQRDVVIVGGGPGGLKTAEIAAERGHRVRLFEAADQLGGQVRWMNSINSRKDYESITRFLINRIEDLAVEVHLDTRLDAAAVEQLGADVVVVATGATGLYTGFNPYAPSQREIPGVHQDNVLSVFDVFGDMDRVGQRVLVIDEFSDAEGAMISEHLADQGRDVEMVSRMPYFAMNVHEDDVALTLGRLAERNVAMTPFTAVSAIDGGRVSGENVLTGEPWSGDYDTVVLHMGKRPEAGLYLELQHLPNVHRVGDAVAPRRVTDAIFEGEQLARSL